MKRILFQTVSGIARTQDWKGRSWGHYEGTIFRFLISLVPAMCLVFPGQVEGGLNYQWISSGLLDNGQEIQQANFLPVYRVGHLGVERSTEGHDYFHPSTRKLVKLVKQAHVDRILPNLQRSFTAPETRREGYLKSALREINYVLFRIVNHPKALALAAPVGKLLGRPNLPISFYQKAINMYPHRALTHAQFGNFLVGIERFEDGIAKLKAAIKIDPELGAAYGWLAWAYEKSGNFELAEEYARKAKKKRYRGKLPKPHSKK